MDQCIIELVDDGSSTPSEIDDMPLRCVDEGWNLAFRLVHREGTVPVPGTEYTAVCQLSQNKAIDCPGLP